MDSSQFVEDFNECARRLGFPSYWEASDDRLYDAPVHVDKETGAIEIEGHLLPFSMDDVEFVRYREMADKDPRTGCPGRCLTIYLKHRTSFSERAYLTLGEDEASGTFFAFDLDYGGLKAKSLWGLEGMEDHLAYEELDDLTAQLKSRAETGLKIV